MPCIPPVRHYIACSNMSLLRNYHAIVTPRVRVIVNVMVCPPDPSSQVLAGLISTGI